VDQKFADPQSHRLLSLGRRERQFRIVDDGHEGSCLFFDSAEQLMQFGWFFLKFRSSWFADGLGSPGKEIGER